MIQRIQTIYLLLCIACIVLCMCNPVGYLDLQDGTSDTLYNLWVSRQEEDGIRHLIMPWPVLFILLTLVASILMFDIFLFKKRALQMRLLNFGLIVLILYYLVAVVFIYIALRGDSPCIGFRPTVWAALPIVAVILGYLAFRAILRDELLVRSLDRLR